MSAKKQSSAQAAPDQVALTASQANMLSSLTGIDASKFKGLSVAEISSQYRWEIDPNLFLFVRICGVVVKEDPSTGIPYPVPYATVYAEETVCSLLGRFPVGLPWGWFYPIECHTETIAQTTTDQCGNFCIWIPRFEIEWILRFRIERICYLQLLNRPTVRSVLSYLQDHRTASTSAEVTLTPGTALYRKAEQLLGAQVTRQLASQSANKAFGAVNTGHEALLARPAFPTSLPPSLPKEFREASSPTPATHSRAVQSTLANKLGIEAKELEGLDLNRYYGPYFRCFDIFIPEWVPIFEVPDIFFRVTQDVSGSGTQVIYTGAPFEVPWSVTGVSNVTLVTTNPLAVSSTNCQTPQVACGNVPSLEFVGLMPLVNPALPAQPYINAVTGYATRPNLPHPDGTLNGVGLAPSTAPYTRTLQLYGCTQVDGAVYYRLRFTYTAPGTTTASSLTPFTGLTWPIYNETGGVLTTQWPASDSNGWYPLPPAGYFPENLLLEWDTIHSSFNANGLYTVQLEVGNSSKAVVATSATVGFMVDNSVPIVSWNAVWSFNSDLSSAQPLPTTDCVVIQRGATPKNVYIQLSYTVTANNLRQVQVRPSGCAGGGTLYPAATTAAQVAAQLATVQHWYEDSADNTVSNVATYVIAASQPVGAYGFDIYADTRAFNPAGSDAGPLADWNYDPPVGYYGWTEPSFAFAVVNEDPS
jgi:hypothetical protein